MKKLLLFLLIISSKSFAQKKYEIAQIKTPLGEILVWLYNETPKHKASFIQLAKGIKKRTNPRIGWKNKFTNVFVKPTKRR